MKLVAEHGEFTLTFTKLEISRVLDVVKGLHISIMLDPDTAEYYLTLGLKIGFDEQKLISEWAAADIKERDFLLRKAEKVIYDRQVEGSN